MARGKYGAPGRAGGGDDYDLVDIGYVPQRAPRVSADDESFGEPGDDETDTAEDESSGGGTQSAATRRPVPAWRRSLASAIAPKPAATRSTTGARTGISGARSGTSLTNGVRSGSASSKATSGSPPGRTPAQIVNGLDKREQVISGIAAGLALTFAIVVGVVGSHPAKGTKDTINPFVLMAVFGLPAVAMLIGVLVKRRALVGFCSLLTGFALFSFGAIPYALIFFILGGWLIFRASRYNKQVAAQGGKTRARTARPAKERPSKDGDDLEAPQPKRPNRKEIAAAHARASAAASKRYTPPRPTSSQRRGTPTR
jgi:hypothetical protein